MIDRVIRNSWPWFLRNIVLQSGDFIFGQRMIKRLSFLEKAQWWDEDRLEGYRNQQLMSLMQTVYQDVPFYQNMMKMQSISPLDIRKPADLIRLPIITKKDLIILSPELITRDTGQKTYRSYTSGSTGTNFSVVEDAATSGWYRASFLLALEWAGWKIGASHLQTGMSLKRSLSKWLKDLVLRCFYVSAFDLSDTQLDANLEIMDRHRIEHLWGYPGSLYCLANRALEKGWNRPLHSIVTWGDNVYPHYRQVIESAFKTSLSDTYGCAEGIQISAQCGHLQTYHIHDLDVIVEYVDDTGNPVSKEEPGNIVLTRLHPGPMPLIRYQVGDIGISGNSNPCTCGRGFTRMQSIQGRDTDIIITPSGNRLIVHFFTGILEHFKEINSFQVVQESIDLIIINIVPNKNFNSSSSRKIIETIINNGARDMEINILLVDDIPLTKGGKRRFIINNHIKDK